MQRLIRFLAVTVLLLPFISMPNALCEGIEAPVGLAKDGMLTYGVAATFPPFEYKQGGKLVGFDIELGEAIAEKLGLKVNIMNMEFKGLIPALQGKRLDIINSAMYIKPERAEQVDFVPYMRVGEEVIVKKGNPNKVKGIEDLCGRTASVTLGAIEEIYAREFSKKCEAAGENPIKILTFPTTPDSAIAVQQGRADMFFISSPGAGYMIKQKPDSFEIVGDTFEAKTLIGIAVRKGDVEMKKAIERAVQAVMADGVYDKIRKKYNLPESVSKLK
jgi:polar amino acid transport system substrate-binding protein